METGHWLTLGIFIATQFISVGGLLIATRIDTRILKERLMDMQQEIEKLGNVLVTLADFKGEINLIQERITTQGKRLDATVDEQNRWRERIEKLVSKE